MAEPSSPHWAGQTGLCDEGSLPAPNVHGDTFFLQDIGRVSLATPMGLKGLLQDPRWILTGPLKASLFETIGFSNNFHYHL